MVGNWVWLRIGASTLAGNMGFREINIHVSPHTRTYLSIMEKSLR